MKIKILKEIHKQIKYEIEEKLKGFKRKWAKHNTKELFMEFIFCLLTPQSRAEICWDAVKNIEINGLLFKGTKKELVEILNKVRFKNNKASYIIEARENFIVNNKFLVTEKLAEIKSVIKKREWLIKNVKGMGTKEASHFLRNIGFSENIAILDRHILKGLKESNVIDAIPQTLSYQRYMEIEKKLRKFADKISIPMSHIDFVYWYILTGRIFK